MASRRKLPLVRRFDQVRPGPALLQLDDGQLEKVVLTQRNQMRAVLITVERYSELERDAA